MATPTLFPNDNPWTANLVSALLLTAGSLASCEAGNSAQVGQAGTPPSVVVASVSAALKAVATGSPLESARPKPRPQALDRAQLLLTPEQRQRLESAYPEARGFIDGLDVESRLYAKGLKRDATKPASTALDALATGKWVLFTGNLINPKPEGFELAVRYVPKDAQDLMGFTSAWLNVRFENIKGFVASEHKAGDLVAILARYNGKQQAAPGYDVVALESWLLPKLQPLQR